MRERRARRRVARRAPAASAEQRRPARTSRLKKPQRSRLLAAHRAAGVEQLGGAALADDARQHRARAHVAAGEADAREQERVLLRAVPRRRSRRQRDDRAGAGADAVDGRDDRLRAGAHRLHQVAGHARERQQLRHRACSTSGPMISCTSPPEQKLPPAPVSTTALTSVGVRAGRGTGRAARRSDSNVSGFLRSGPVQRDASPTAIDDRPSRAVPRLTSAPRRSARCSALPDASRARAGARRRARSALVASSIPPSSSAIQRRACAPPSRRTPRGPALGQRHRRTLRRSLAGDGAPHAGPRSRARP